MEPTLPFPQQAPMSPIPHSEQAIQNDAVMSCCLFGYRLSQMRHDAVTHGSSSDGTESPSESLTALRLIKGKFSNYLNVISAVKCHYPWVLFLLFITVVKPFIYPNKSRTFLFTPVTLEVYCGGGCVTHHTFATSSMVFCCWLLPELCRSSWGSRAHKSYVSDTQPHRLQLHSGQRAQCVQFKVKSRIFRLASVKRMLSDKAKWAATSTKETIKLFICVNISPKIFIVMASHVLDFHSAAHTGFALIS